jgi:hypothetical protein
MSYAPPIWRCCMKTLFAYNDYKVNPLDIVVVDETSEIKG